MHLFGVLEKSSVVIRALDLSAALLPEWETIRECVYTVR
jgi:hypothetical protein